MLATVLGSWGRSVNQINISFRMEFPCTWEPGDERKIQQIRKLQGVLESDVSGGNENVEQVQGIRSVRRAVGKEG